MKSKLLSLVVLLGACSAGTSFGDTTIISDGFSTTGNYYGNTPSPDGVDLPHSTYVSNGLYVNNSGGEAVLNHRDGAYISVASNPTYSYVKPTTLTISADFTLVSNGAGSSRFELGYTPDATDLPYPYTNGAGASFNGLIVATDGTVSLYSGNTLSLDQTIQSGGFQLSGIDLTYTINTMTGSITDASMSYLNNSSTLVTMDYGNAFASGSAGLFTDANTQVAEFINGDDYAYNHNEVPVYVDSFSVSGNVATPEPSTCAMLAFGLGLMAFLQVRRTARLKV